MEIKGNAPGKSHREGVSLFEVMDMFSTELKAERWFIEKRWGARSKIACPFCDSRNILHCKNRKPQPFRCRACRKHFSVKTDTFMHGAKIPLAKWGVAIYLYSTSLKGVSSMKLHRDLKVTQKTAWYMGHRIREAWDTAENPFSGEVEVDETYIGGKERNKHEAKKTNAGRGAVGKTAVVGMKSRDTGKVAAEVVETTDKHTLQGFVAVNTEVDATVYTDEAQAYVGMRRRHEAVKHSVKEYVRGQAHTNGIESLWSTLKRGYVGTYHQFSVKHLSRYVNEFAGRHNQRPLDTEAQMGRVVRLGEGKRLRYADLIGEPHTRQPSLL